MSSLTLRFAAGLAAITLASHSQAHAELVNASDPPTIEAILESQGWPTRLVTADAADPYIESSHDGIKFIILFMNCDGGRNCKTLQYYMGFNDAKDISFERLNEWNRDMRFARAYRDDEGDPVLEMDVDLDFAGIPRENVGESLNTWVLLMHAFRNHIFAK